MKGASDMVSGISPPSDDRSRSTPAGESNEEDPELGDVSVPAMSVVPVGSRAFSSRDVRSRDRNATPPRRTPIVEEPDSDSTATPLVCSPQVPAPDPSRNECCRVCGPTCAPSFARHRGSSLL